MSGLVLDVPRTALIVIDLQKGITAAATTPYTSNEVVERSRRLAKRVREKGGLVVYVRVDVANILPLPADMPMRAPGAPPPPADFAELLPEAGVRQGDLVVTKRHWGAFAGTDLEQSLRERGIDTVVITGIATNIGVESTVRQGTGLGFGFVVVEDACSARDAEGHKYAMEKIFPRLARVRKTDEVVEALG